jgi:hypothetical protein
MFLETVGTRISLFFGKVNRGISNDLLMEWALRALIAPRSDDDDFVANDFFESGLLGKMQILVFTNTEQIAVIPKTVNIVAFHILPFSFFFSPPFVERVGWAFLNGAMDLRGFRIIASLCFSRKPFSFRDY